MAALQHDFEIDQGAHWEKELVWRGADGQPVNVSDYTAKMDIRRRYVSETAVFTLSSTGDTPEIELGANGTIRLVLLASDTRGIAAKSYVYDLEMTPPAPDEEKVVRLLQGTVTVSPEVTRDPPPAP